MSNKNRRDVVRDGDEWAVTAPGASRASAKAPTQDAAAQRATDIVRNAGGGEVVIHRPNGEIRDKRTIAPGNDPFPPRDKK